MYLMLNFEVLTSACFIFQNCGNTSFGCGTGTVSCIDIELRCDGTVDCEDGADESEYFTGCAGTICSRNGAGNF